MRRNKALRHQPSPLEEARRVEYFRERAARADIDKARKVLKRAGKRKPPIPGDEK